MANDKFKNFRESEITTNFCEAVQQALLGFGGRGVEESLLAGCRPKVFFALQKISRSRHHLEQKIETTRPVYFAGLKVFDTHILFGRQFVSNVPPFCFYDRGCGGPEY